MPFRHNWPQIGTSDGSNPQNLHTISNAPTATTARLQQTTAPEISRSRGPFRHCPAAPLPRPAAPPLSYSVPTTRQIRPPVSSLM